MTKRTEPRKKKRKVVPDVAPPIGRHPAHKSSKKKAKRKSTTKRRKVRAPRSDISRRKKSKKKGAAVKPGGMRRGPGTGGK